MQRDAQPVNAGKRISRMEARREKLLVTIERTRRRFEKYDKGAKRALKDLAKHERAVRRMDKAIAKAKTEAADAHVESVAKPKLEAMEQMLGEAIYGKAAPAPRGSVALASPDFAGDLAVAAREAGEDQGVPQFLKDAAAERNRKLNSLPNPNTKEKKAERRAVEREKREADLRGKRRRFPPTGKSALDVIRKSD